MDERRTPNGTAFDGRRVYLPEASSVGYDVKFAKPGCWIAFSDGGRRTHALVVGRVADGDHRGMLVVLCLSLLSGDMYERWVAPEDVERCVERLPGRLLRALANCHESYVRKHGREMLADARDGYPSESAILYEGRGDRDQARRARWRRLAEDK